MIHVNNRIFISAEGVLCDKKAGGQPVSDTEAEHRFRLRGGQKFSKIGGGTIQRYLGPGNLELRKFTEPDGRVWWDSPDGTLCTLKDIDAVRKLRKELDARKMEVTR